MYDVVRGPFQRVAFWSADATTFTEDLDHWSVTGQVDQVHPASGTWVTYGAIARTPTGARVRRDPDWRQRAVAELAQLERLTPDWDGYGGLPVARVHANRALRFLRRFMTDQSPMPEIVPLADGGVQLEWRLPAGRVDFVTDSEAPHAVLLIERPGAHLEELQADAYPDRALADVIGQAETAEAPRADR